MPDQQVLDYVTQSFGGGVATYLQRKNTGGAAGSKGIQYENLYAVYHISRMVPFINLDETKRLNISTQTLDFVDDLIIEDRFASSRRQYQLKNTDNVAWGAGKNKICDDFRYQKRVNKHIGIEHTRLALVVPNQSKAKALRKHQPTDINGFSRVEHFGFAETLSATLQVEPKLYESLADLCVKPEPSKIDRLGSLIMGEWVARLGAPCTIEEIWEGVKRHQPNYLAYATQTELKPEVNKLLVQIPGFTFRLEKGFFVWQYRECDSGELNYPIDSEDFKEFQLQILAREPRDFEDMEDLLV